MNKCDQFIDHINAHVLPFIDYNELDRSYKTPDKAYAKGVLNILHSEMVKIYGGDTLTPDYENDDDYAVVPGVIQGMKTGNVAIALLGIDLMSSGEHCETDILCKYGLVSQGKNNLPPFMNAEISLDYIPYDYGYTARIPGDIHVQHSRLPYGIKEMLDTFQSHTVELLCSEETDMPTAQDDEADFDR